MRASDIVRWGRSDLWEVVEAACLLADIAPSQNANDRYPDRAIPIYDELMRSIPLGFPSLVRGPAKIFYLLPLQVIQWAEQKQFPVPEGLKEEVIDSARRSLEARGKMAKQSPSPTSTEGKGDVLPPTSPDSTAAPQKPVPPKARLEPQGGDTLTPTIWGICYDLMDEGRKISAVPVMARLIARADTAVHPLLCSVAGGVKYESADGDECELNAAALQSRINVWKKAVNS